MAADATPARTGLTTPDAVRAVIENPDPLVRNLQITLSYHELTLALDRLLGGADAPEPPICRRGVPPGSTPCGPCGPCDTNDTT